MKIILLTGIIGVSTLLTGCRDVAVVHHRRPAYARVHYDDGYYSGYRRPYSSRRYYSSRRNYDYDRSYYGRTHYRTNYRDWDDDDHIHVSPRRVISTPRRVIRRIVR